jgi:hypothetical protein
MNNIYLQAALAWLIPGAGHFLQRRFVCGGLLCVSFLLLTVLGTVLGGLYYPGSAREFGAMYYLHELSCFGNGVSLFLNLILKDDLSSVAAREFFRSAYIEYGGRCLALAGLLNYLAILDVFDFGSKRKVYKV